MGRRHRRWQGHRVWRIAAILCAVVASGLFCPGLGLGAEPLPGAQAPLVLPLLLKMATGLPVPTLTPSPSPTPTPTATPEVLASLSITQLSYAGNDEFVTIRNNGLKAQTMTGWRLHSVVGNQWFTFPAGHLLAAGASVRVHSGPGALDDPPHELLWMKSHVWNNEGDEAVLYDAGGRAVDRRAY